MDSEQMEMVQRWIEETVAPLREKLDQLEIIVARLDSVDYAREEHYHDNYASADHVERSEDSFNSQLYRLRNDLDNLDYRVNDVDRKAERAQSAADDARRSQGRGW
jgi:small-conductance mechanosensitive channel